MKKIARSLRQHRELILNYFRAQKLFQRRRGGFEQQGESHYEVFAPTGYSNWPFITHLASCPSRNRPTISSDDS
jgi:hypothetical protein